jgi:hypothetical protein
MLVSVRVRLVILKFDAVTGEVFATKIGNTDPDSAPDLQKLTFTRDTVNLLAVGDQFDVELPDVDMVPA